MTFTVRATRANAYNCSEVATNMTILLEQKCKA